MSRNPRFLFALALGCVAAGAPGQSPAARPRGDVDGVCKAVYRRLYKDFCSWNKSIAAVFLARDVPSRGAPLDPGLVGTMQKLLPLAVYEKADLPEDVAYIERELTEPETGKPAAQLTVRRIEWTGEDSATAVAEFGRSALLTLPLTYRVKRMASRWDVVGSGVSYDWNHRVLTGANRGHSFRVDLRQRPFDLRHHRVEREDTDEFHGYRIDGVGGWLIGTVGNVPQNELASFAVHVDGVEWKVPAKLWKDCYEPHLRPQSGNPLLFAWLSADGARLTVKMLGSDAGGSYRVVWHLRRDGKHTRSIEGLC